MESMQQILKNKPTGCFPPIFPCKRKNNDKDKNIDLQTRGFTQNESNSIVSLRELMNEKQQDVKPFIDL
jgi:hypothetical protein